MDEQLEFAKLIASRLDNAGIPYMLTGSMAMTIYSIPRMWWKMSDTSERVERLYGDMLLSRTPLERLRMASRMYDSAKKLVMAGIRDKNPHLTVSQLRTHLFLRMYGSDFTRDEREKIIKSIPDMQLDTDS